MAVWGRRLRPAEVQRAALVLNVTRQRPSSLPERQFCMGPFGATGPGLLSRARPGTWGVGMWVCGYVGMYVRMYVGMYVPGGRTASRERAWGDGPAPLSSSQEGRARSSQWGTGRETAKGVGRVKSSQLPFSIRFCFASSEFRHLHNSLSFKNNVGVPDIELCKQACSQLSEELLLPPLAPSRLLAQMCWPPEESHEHIFQKVSPSQNPNRMAVSYKPVEIISWLFPFMTTHLLFPASFDIKRRILSHSHQKQEGRSVSPTLGFWLKLFGEKK